jgi:hypothetical protein
VEEKKIRKTVKLHFFLSYFFFESSMLRSKRYSVTESFYENPLNYCWGCFEAGRSNIGPKRTPRHLQGSRWAFLEVSTTQHPHTNRGRVPNHHPRNLRPRNKKRVQDIIVKHQLTCQVGSMWKTKRTLNKEPRHNHNLQAPRQGACCR